MQTENLALGSIAKIICLAASTEGGQPDVLNQHDQGEGGGGHPLCDSSVCRTLNCGARILILPYKRVPKRVKCPIFRFFLYPIFLLEPAATTEYRELRSSH